MKILDVGCGDRKDKWPENSDGIDMFDYGQKYVFNIEDTDAWSQIPDNTYDKVLCKHILEHIQDGYAFIEILNEIWRVLKPDGVFVGESPHFPSSPNYYRDPTHCRPINEYTFDMFLVGSKIHVGTGYNIKCHFDKQVLTTNPNKDIMWILAAVK